LAGSPKIKAHKKFALSSERRQQVFNSLMYDVPKEIKGVLLMKKQFLASIMAITVILSGAVGFGGAYLANSLAIAPAAAAGEISTLAQSAVFDQGTAEIEANLDGYPAAMQIANLAPNGMALLNSTNSTSTPQELTIPEIAALASHSIVEIYTETVVNSGRLGQFITEGAGSGVIVSADGYIVTNNHVIEGAKKITVRLKNGADHEAALIGRDTKTDLAVLKSSASGLQPAGYGNLDKLEVGELAVANGNPLGQLGGTVTEGIISALSRNIDIDGHMMTLLQTSAAVNPGNSGGGLFNRFGELIGIVNAKSSGTDIEGISFAIPANLAKPIVDALISHGYVPGRIDLGAVLIDVLDARSAMLYRLQATGVYVAQADADSPLQAGDRLISINGVDINGTAKVKELLDTYKVGDVLSVAVWRSGKSTSVNLTLKQAKS
jgi:serine protease Do